MLSSGGETIGNWPSALAQQRLLDSSCAVVWEKCDHSISLCECRDFGPILDCNASCYSLRCVDVEVTARAGGFLNGQLCNPYFADSQALQCSSFSMHRFTSNRIKR